MNNRKLWRALVAALMCAALLCPTLALAEADGLTINDTADDALALELDEAFDGAVPDLPDLELSNDLVLDDLVLDEGLTADENGPIALGGDTFSNESGNDSGDSQETPAPEDVVTLVARYTGEPLTKVYDCNKYGAYSKKLEDGTYETVYIIEALKTIRSKFTLTPVKGKSFVPDHKNVGFKLTLFKQFFDKDDPRQSADVGKYNFEFTLALTGDDAAWYTLKNPVVKVPVTVTPREVVVTPTEGLSKVYGADDPVFPDGFILSKDETSPLYQDCSGLPRYALPLRYYTGDDGKTHVTLNITGAAYLLREAQLKGTKFFPNDGFLSRKRGEKAGEYRITRGALDFGSNFKIKVAEEYFTIKPRDINDSDVVVKAVTDKTFTGKFIKPSPVVRYNGKKLKLGTAYKLSYTHNRALGNATIAITGKGNFTGTRKLVFRIVLKPTTLSRLIAGKGQIAVAWKKGKQNAGYEIAYSTDADFFYSQTKTVKGINRTTLTLKDLQPKTTYYVRVRTYRKSGGEIFYSAWSKAKKAKTK